MLIASLVLQRLSSAKQILDVGFSTSNFDLILSSTSIFSWIVAGMSFISTRAPSIERSHASTTLNPGRSLLNRASDMLAVIENGELTFAPIDL